MKFFNYKRLFWIILVVAILEGAWIYFSSDLTRRINMAEYTFTDSGGDLVTATGSWISTSDIAFPLSTAEIDCWKDFGHCWMADATIMDNEFLSVGMKLHEIAEWNDDYITTKPSQPLLGCVEETYRFDRKRKVVTYTRSTVDTSGLCEGMSKEPIVARLGDGLERLGVIKK